MKTYFKLFFILPLIFTLGACSSEEDNPTGNGTDNTNNPDQTPVDEEIDEHGLPIKHMQDTPILHCFNWSMSNIEANLDSIKEAGFKTIQLSPMQPQKDVYDGDWSGQWWKLYQPLGFSVSTGYDQNRLGGKSELTSLCNKAKEKGIDVIVDIVANHLGGGGKFSFHSGVQSNEPEIYNNNLHHNVNKKVSDTDIEALTKGWMGDFPDLTTEDSRVQNRVLSLLKEYLDCGINGFRFDAAKHIETPEDGQYASNFWPVVLDGATSYAETKGYSKPFYYGEVLTTVGSGRQVSQYTDRMSITESVFSSNYFMAVDKQSMARLDTKYIGSAEKSILWGESHDTYSNDGGETSGADQEDVDKAYAMATSRKSVATLYLSRPQGKLGSVGSKAYESKTIIAVNKFHNYCLGLDEQVSQANGLFINERGSKGAVIVNINGSAGSVTLNNLEDGTYINLVTGANVNISNHTTSVSFTKGICVLLNKEYYDYVSKDVPSISLAAHNEVYSGTQNITVNTVGAEKVTYTINNSDPVELTGSTIVLPNSLPNGFVTLKVIATNNIGSSEVTSKMFKTDALVNKSLIITDVDTSVSLLLWAWKDSGAGSWLDSTKEGSNIGFDMGNKNNFILVKFPLGTTSSSANWDNKIAQTQNISFSKRIYSYSEFYS